ncbi:class II fructose-bisphosphate aldolase [Microbacterium aerolatum]|uniref:Fructose-bisphosphate aldolase n=1 Tax=Microbacterium aerolatum TaxID=153731 RepID=A0A511AID4_9MICO|nr:class II fructose-bisphosphate aldolase [Microbacterium aerolatum]GEK87944.1 fructose-bisphosphate aldolase [Microbacterium aerolatum]GGB32183.1 fructose-bisphosphate aldolase [Microbacterium aerolatum]
MTLAAAGELLSDATLRGRAVPAFNVITLEQAEAVVGGAEDAGIGVLIQLSQNATVFRGGFAPLLSACRELAREASVAIGIHLDHIEDDELALAIIERSAELGVGSLMFDRASLPYAENVALTARVAAAAHGRALWIEGELGEVGGKDGAHAPGVRTDPDEAASFVRDTAVDLLAVAVGSSHAMTERAAVLDLELIGRLDAAVPVPLVLHGSSGVPDGMLSDAVSAGIRKVNVGTALGVVGTARLRRELAERPDAVDPRSYLRGVRTATRDEVARLASVVG